MSFRNRLVINRCSFTDCKIHALVLSDPPFCPVHLPDLAAWISRVEQEKDRMLAALAREQYIVIHEEQAPVSGLFYHKVSGEPPPNVALRVSDVLAFCALASASGVIGNLAYATLRNLVLKLVGPERQQQFDNKISAEFYEHVRGQVHGENVAADERALESVQLDLRLKYRLIVEKRERRGRIAGKPPKTDV
jgi:hypothetical protein